MHDESDVMESAADRSKLDDSVLESLSDLLKRGGVENSQFYSNPRVGAAAYDSRHT